MCHTLSAKDGAYRFKKGPMLEMIPHHGLVLEQRAQQKETVDGFVSCVQSSLDIDI